MDFGHNQVNSNEDLQQIDREKVFIQEEQDKLDAFWEEELKRREKAGYFYPLRSMFDDGVADQYNEKSQELMDRRENNQKRLEDLI